MDGKICRECEELKSECICHIDDTSDIEVCDYCDENIEDCICEKDTDYDCRDH